MASIARTGLLRQSPLLSGRFVSTSATVRQSSSLRSHSLKPLPLARLAPFSTSSRNNLLPAGPQVIKGGVNDPAEVPPTHPTHGSYHWDAERLLSIGLIPLTIAPFAAQTMNPTLDAILVGTLLIHSHMGFSSIITDYIPDYRFPKSRKVADYGLILATVLVGVGFYEFETNDVGLTEAIKRIWHAGKNDATIGKSDLGGLGHDGQLKHLVK